MTRKSMQTDNTPRIVGERGKNMTSMAELKKISVQKEVKGGAGPRPLTFCECNDQIAFCDEDGYVWATPYSKEVYLFLIDNGYVERCIFI